MNELKGKKCPFCGGKKLFVRRDIPSFTESGEVGTMYFWVECEDCHAKGPRTVKFERACELWNRREP